MKPYHYLVVIGLTDFYFQAVNLVQMFLNSATTFKHDYKKAIEHSLTSADRE